jgi:hypothetical protein
MMKLATRGLAVALVATLAGCGGRGNALPQQELDRAQDALQGALDVWKKGGKPAAVKAPVTEVADPDWKDGVRLADYMIYNTEPGPGEDIRCGVALLLHDRQGKRLPKDVVYHVRGKDKLVIERQPGK